jgi:hypothetical protein
MKQLHLAGSLRRSHQSVNRPSARRYSQGSVHHLNYGISVKQEKQAAGFVLTIVYD